MTATGFGRFHVESPYVIPLLQQVPDEEVLKWLVSSEAKIYCNEQ